MILAVMHRLTNIQRFDRELLLRKDRVIKSSISSKVIGHMLSRMAILHPNLKTQELLYICFY